VNNAQNLRAGGSRNHGVREAKGDYVVFMDADDYYDSNFVECVNYLKGNSELDILCFDKTRHLRGENEMKPVHAYKHLEVMTGRMFFVLNSFPCGPTQYIFKRNLMVDNQLWFEENCSCEDVDWALKLPFYARKMQFLPIIGYHYVLEPGSTTGSEFRHKERVFDRVRSAFRVSELINLYDSPEESDIILGLASHTAKYGLLFFCGLSTSSKEKVDIIKRYIPQELNIGKLNWVKQYPYSYAMLSTYITPPMFRLLIALRRKLKQRK
jgi:glycosyltransferase involved in cell wall biosynthesis